jgi:hypothetical protein
MKLHWSKNRFFGGPAAIKASRNRGMGDSAPIHPCRYAKSFTINGQDAIVATITRLLFRRSPIAVFRRIGTIVISSFKSHARRPVSHICQKVFERIQPTVTNEDFASTIASICRIILIKTSRFHASPRKICWRNVVSSSVVVPSVSLSQFLGKKTTATCSASTFKRGGNDRFLVAAVTSAFPKSSLLFCSQKLYDGPPSKAKPGEILKIMRSHSLEYSR